MRSHTKQQRGRPHVLLAACLLFACGRAAREVPELQELPSILPYEILHNQRTRLVEWPFAVGGQQYALEADGVLDLRLRHCVFHFRSDAHGTGRVLATPLDEFSVFSGEGSVVVECANESNAATLRLITCNGAFELQNGNSEIQILRDLAVATTSDRELDFLPGETANPDLRIRVVGERVRSTFGPRGTLLAIDATPEALPEATARDRYARELEHAVVLVEDALNSVTASFREGQDLSAQLALATRQGNHEERARASSLLADNATRQHRARELLRLRYGRLLACDMVREQQHLEIPRLSAAYYPRVRAELGL